MTAAATSLFDVIVIGGGPAGLSAALALGRSRRRVIVIDAGEPRNAVAEHMHGVLGHDGRSPAEFLALGRAEVEAYGVTLIAGRAVSARRADDRSFHVVLEDRSVIHARRVLVTSGITDHLPDVDGLRERWGRDVVHCPYCHGWEVRDSRITVVADNPMGAHSALLFSQWSGEVSLVAQSGAEFTDDERRRMDIRGIELVGSPAVSVAVEDDRIVGLRLADGRVHPTDVVAVPVRTVATSVVLESLGLAAVDHPMGSAMGSTFVADDTGRTAVPGVWAAGNVVSPFATVPASVAAGYQTGALINADLLDDDIAAADAPTTPSGTADGPPVMDERFWDKRYGSADRIWSGRPNPGLVAEVAELAPGRVLDIGAGEGADAIWLAERGWDVVAVDISSVALERGRRQAAIAGSEVSDRITWVHADLLATGLPSGPFDLVSSHYMQLAPDQRAALFGQYFDVVGPGGRVLIVGHHPSDMATKVGRPPRAELFYTAEDLTPDLDPAFEVLVAEARPRVVEHDGEPTTIHDTVFVARRSG